MIFNPKLLDVIKPKFVQRVIHKAKVSEALDKLDTQKIALLFKEEVEDDLDPSELRDNIVECVLEYAKDEMVWLILFKIYDKYVIDIAMDFFDTLRISDFDKDKTMYQAREDTVELVQDRICDKFYSKIYEKVDEKLNGEFDEKVDEILEIVETMRKKV